ncbi:protein kinase family protein [Candidatus Bathyarchaeota archaeon]|nr:protein kinase family protein [Candidatus Bathyarchaeota archaeon]
MENIAWNGDGAAATTRHEISSIQDLDAIVDTRDATTAAIKYTTFYLFTSNDVALLGKIPKAKAEITIGEYTAALERVPDRSIFPALTNDTVAVLTSAPEGNDNQYIKRPNMSMYELCDHDDDFLASLLLSEAATMEQIARHPHPNIVRYHGVRARRGRITGLVLEKYPITLLEHVQRGMDLDEEKVMAALESAVEYLHSLGLAHNDIHPVNIMVSAEKMPVLIDFDSCQPFGKRLMSQGTPGWADVFDGLSGKEHDIYALSRVREWFKEPWFD